MTFHDHDGAPCLRLQISVRQSTAGRPGAGWSIMVAIPSPGPDRLTRRMALQDGAITASQVRQLGVSHDAIEAHVDAHRWQRLHRGVFAVFTGPVPFRTRVWAALLRAGETATASHATAAGNAGVPAPAYYTGAAGCRHVGAEEDPLAGAAGSDGGRCGAGCPVPARTGVSAPRRTCPRLPRGERNRRWVDRRVTWVDVDLDEFGVRVELDGRLGTRG